MNSKQSYPFPYCDYPYTSMEKLKHYCGVFLCGIMKYIGVDMYARFLLKQPYLTNEEILKNNLKELNESSLVSMDNGKWHFKSLMCGLVVMGSTYFGLSRYSLIPLDYYNKYMHYGVLGIGSFIVNSLYSIMANMYNCIRFNQQVNIINHGIKIELAAKAVMKDFDSLIINSTIDSAKDFDVDTDQKYEVVKQRIYEKIDQNKKLWRSFSHENSDGTITYVIHNGYYEKLLFVFHIETSANEFMDILNDLSMEYIDLLSIDEKEVLRLQNKFIKGKIYYGLFNSYLVEKN